MNVHVLAGLLPVLGLVSILGWLAAPGPRPPAPLAARFDLLGETPADVVVVGPSFVRTDFDLPVLKAGLDVGHIAAYNADGTSAPVWYAALARCVYSRSPGPRLVIVAMATGAGLVVGGEPSQLTKLEQLMPEPDAVVSRLTYGTRVPAWLRRLSARRSALRDPLLLGFRDVVPRLLMHGDREAVDAAGAAVFATVSGPNFAASTPTGDLASTGPAVVQVSRAEDSYLEAIANLVEANGGRLVIVLPPVAANTSLNLSQDVAVEADLVRWANARGVGWIDARAMRLAPAMFTDPSHLNPSGATAFTQHLVEALRGIGALDDGPLRAAREALAPTLVHRYGVPEPVRHSVVRVGPGPCAVTLSVPVLRDVAVTQTRRSVPRTALPLVVGEGADTLDFGPLTGACSGHVAGLDALRIERREAEGPELSVTWSDALPVTQPGRDPTWWVYPGTSVRWDFDSSWGKGATVALRVVGIGASGSIRARVGDETREVESGATLRFPMPDTRHWEIEVSADVGFAVVRALTLHAGDTTVHVVRPAPPRTIDVMRRGEWRWPEVPVLAHGPPINGAFEVPERRLAGCSRYRVRAGETLLSPLAVTPSAASPGSIHIAGKVFFVTGGANDAAAHSKLSLVNDPERDCNGATGGPAPRWFYPGDHAVASIPAGPRATLVAALSGLTMTASGAGGPLAVEVRLDGVSRLRVDTTADGEAHRWPIDPPIDVAEPGALEVHVWWTGTSPGLVSAVLNEVE